MFKAKKTWFCSLTILAICLYAVFYITSAEISSQVTLENTPSHGEDDFIKIDDETLKRFKIKTQIIHPRDHQIKLTVPGQVSLNENQLIHVISPVNGVARQVLKNLGDTVEQSTPLAVIESREMAEIKASYIAAFKDVELKKDLTGREELLVKKKIKAETEFLKTKNIYETAKIELDQKKQKLLALNLTEEEIINLPSQKDPLNLYTVHAPIQGKILERHLALGEFITSETQLFVIANLSKIWINLSISAQDLPNVKIGQEIEIFPNYKSNPILAKIMFISPVVKEATRTGRAIVELDNSNNQWHPGDFVSAQITLEKESSYISIPSKAIQKINGKSTVFIKTGSKFKPQRILINGSDKGHFVLIQDGLKLNDEIVIDNSFLLKAELGKSDAEHAH